MKVIPVNKTVKLRYFQSTNPINKPIIDQKSTWSKRRLAVIIFAATSICALFAAAIVVPLMISFNRLNTEMTTTTTPTSVPTSTILPSTTSPSASTISASVSTSTIPPSTTLPSASTSTISVSTTAASTMTTNSSLITPSTSSLIITTTSNMIISSSTCASNGLLITFDNLLSAGPVPNGYDNIIWTNAYSSQATTNTSGYYTSTISSPSAIYNSFGNPMTIESANSSLINLYSLAVAAAWHDNLQLTIDGLISGVTVISNTYTLQVFTVSYLTFSGYIGLDMITFTTFGGTQSLSVTGSGTHFGMDNICLSFT